MNLLKNALLSLKKDHPTTNPDIIASLVILERNDLDQEHFDNIMFLAFKTSFPGNPDICEQDYTWPELFHNIFKDKNPIKIRPSNDSIGSELSKTLINLLPSTNFEWLLSLYIYREMIKLKLVDDNLKLHQTISSIRLPN